MIWGSASEASQAGYVYVHWWHLNKTYFTYLLTYLHSVYCWYISFFVCSGYFLMKYQIKCEIDTIYIPSRICDKTLASGWYTAWAQIIFTVQIDTCTQNINLYLLYIDAKSYICIFWVMLHITVDYVKCCLTKIWFFYFEQKYRYIS